MKAALEREPQQRVLGFPFDARPHGPPTFRAVSTFARNITEREPASGRRCQRRRGGKREVVRQLVVLALAQSDGRDAQTVEARIEVGECRLEVPEVGEVRVHDLTDLWIADVGHVTREGQYGL